MVMTNLEKLLIFKFNRTELSTFKLRCFCHDKHSIRKLINVQKYYLNNLTKVIIKGKTELQHTKLKFYIYSFL